MRNIIKIFLVCVGAILIRESHVVWFIDFAMVFAGIICIMINVEVK